jgi:hypothetical protein
VNSASAIGGKSNKTFSTLKFWWDLVGAFEIISILKKGAYPATLAGSLAHPCPHLVTWPHLRSERGAAAPASGPSCHRPLL